MLSSPEDYLPPKVVFQGRLSSTEGHHPPKVDLHQRSSSTKGCHPPKVIFHQRSPSTYHNTLFDHIFVRTVNIPYPTLLRSGLKKFWTHTHTNHTKPYIEIACCLKILLIPFTQKPESRTQFFFKRLITLLHYYLSLDCSYIVDTHCPEYHHCDCFQIQDSLFSPPP